LQPDGNTKIETKVSGSGTMETNREGVHWVIMNCSAHRKEEEEEVDDDDDDDDDYYYLYYHIYA
jgi:hypothetical protein